MQIQCQNRQIQIHPEGLLQMKFPASILLLMLLLISSSYGEVSITGYFEPQYYGAVIDDNFLQLNSNKLRIDLSSDLSDNITFTGNFNYINYNGQKTWSMLDFLPEKLTSAIPEQHVPLYSFEYKDEDKLDNAYIRLYSNIFTLTAGRQQISVGSGYAWNPTDLFNLKDILDPVYEQLGVNGLRLDVGFSSEYTFMLFYSPESTWEESGKLLRFMGRISHFDYALSAGRKQQVFTDYNSFQRNGERRDMLGIDLIGEILGLGIWTENACNYMENSPDYWENLFGIDYTFSSGLYMMAEYYHNEQGRKEDDQYTLNDWMRYLNTETKALSRHQIYLYSLYPATDLFNIGGSMVCSISDYSLLLMPTFEYSLSNNLTLTFFGNIYAGREGTMYSNDMGNGGVLRLRAYF